MRVHADRMCHHQPPHGWTKEQGCHVLQCGGEVIAWGMCWEHYQRARRGMPVYVYTRHMRQRQGLERSAYFGPRKAKLSERRLVLIQYELATNWTPDPNTGCHLWLGTYHPNGYGYIGSGRDPWGRWAHRAVAYFRGDFTASEGRRMHVRHTCDNPACVNPDHLIYSTALENMQDRDRKGRGRHGNPWEHGGSKLSLAQVAELKAALARGERQCDLARKYGGLPGHVWAIAHGRVWAGVSPLPDSLDNAA